MDSHASAADEVRGVMDAVRHLVRALRVSARASERDVGLSGAQLFVLQQLVEAGPCSIGELAERTRTHQSSVSVVVTRLDERGLVRRATSEVDRRRVEVSVTPLGLARLEGAPPLAQAHLLGALHRMDPALRAALRDGLGQLVEAVTDASAEPPLFFEDEVGAHHPEEA
jgi:DNA-binding MarR family transcriptional regulator